MASGAFLIFAFALPTSLDPLTYALSMIAASLFLTIPQIKYDPGEIVSKEYLAFCAVILFYLVVSIFGVLPRSGFFYDRSHIIHQSAGLLLTAATYPAFVVAARWLFFPRTSLLFLATAAILSVVLSQVIAESNVIIADQLYGAKSSVVLMQFVWFLVAWSTGRKMFQIPMMLLPILVLGSATNLLIQAALIGILLTRGNRALPIAIVVAMAVFIYLMASENPFMVRLIEGDPNSLVRAHLWAGAAVNIVKHPLGLGFGTTYTDVVTRYDPMILFGPYGTDLSRAFEVANHNTFLDTLLRLGPLGFVALLALLFNSWWRLRQPRQIMMGSALLAITIVICGLNPILESAQSALFVAFATGYLRAARRHDEATAAPAWVQPVVHRPRPESPRERRQQLAAQVHD